MQKLKHAAMMSYTERKHDNPTISLAYYANTILQSFAGGEDRVVEAK